VSSQNIIKLNDDLYDADSGNKLNASSKSNDFTKSTDGFSQLRHHPPRTASHRSHRATHKKSTTLKRQAVHKPINSNQPIKTSQDTSQNPVVSALKPQSVPSGRLRRLSEVPRSSLIKRFNNAAAAPTINKEAEIEGYEPLAGAVHSSALVQRAFEQADSHNQPKINKPPRRHRLAAKLHLSPKALNVGAAVLAVLLLVGFYGYLNVPNLAMKVAAARSHVDGSLPKYRPPGFSLNGSIKYQPGEIDVAYKSNSDSRSFVLSQRSSAWNSETLKQNYLAYKSAQAYPENGKTIYVYEGSNATWVDSGIWYLVEGNSGLSTDQLLNLAKSL
jgi:hypothetical protein